MFNIRSSFITRINQFEENKTTEAVGILREAISGNGIFEFKLGNTKKIYFRDKQELREKARHTIWKNPQRKEVAIFPLFEFHQTDDKQGSLF